MSKDEGESARQGRQPAGEPVGDPAAVCEKGNYIQGDPEDGFSSSYPFVPPPPSGPLRHSGSFRHSGESRNPEDTFPLGPDFRRGDEGGASAEAGIHPLNSRFHGNDDRVGSSSM